MNLIVAYDIADPRRLSRVAKIMADYGARVQKSIFEVELTPNAFLEMKGRVDKVIVFAADGVKYFPLCRKCAGTVEVIGKGQLTDADRAFYIY